MLKVGVFDSGLGGLTVVKALGKVIKGANIFYVADTKNAPYGEKTPEQISQYSLNITSYLIDTYNIDALILACNTATSFAIKQLRELYPHLIIIGTEPGVKPAIEQTKTGKIGVLATPATLKGEKYQELVNLIAKDKDVEVFEQACPGLVEQIEKGEISTESTKILLEKWLHPMKNKNVDTIVLGCTHYPLVSDEISKIMFHEVILIDTGLAIANRLHSLAVVQGYKDEGNITINIEATGDIEHCIVEDILNSSVDIKYININNN